MTDYMWWQRDSTHSRMVRHFT